MQGRHKLDEVDLHILHKAKSEITKAVEELKERGVRHANIEIELVWHVKDSLKE